MRARIIIAIPLHCRYVNSIYEERNEKAVYHAPAQKRLTRFHRDYNHSSKSMRESSARLFLEPVVPPEYFVNCWLTFWRRNYLAHSVYKM